MSFYLGIQKTKNKTSWEKINTLCTYTDHLHAMTQVTQSPAWPYVPVRIETWQTK